MSDEHAQQKEALHTIKQKESKATNMVNELTAVRTFLMNDCLSWLEGLYFTFPFIYFKVYKFSEAARHFQSQGQSWWRDVFMIST